MAEWILSLFQGSLAQLTFFSIFAAGLLFSLVSLATGGHAEHGGDDVDFHGHDGAGGDHDGAGGDHDSDHGPSLLSIRGASLLAVGFGGVGYIIQHFTGRALLASFGGLMFGWVFAFVVLAMLRVFLRQQASSQVEPRQVLNAQGVVTTSIPAGQPGEVMLSVAGSQVTKMAEAADGSAIPRATTVRVVRYFGGIVTVEPIDNAP